MNTTNLLAKSRVFLNEFERARTYGTPSAAVAARQNLEGVKTELEAAKAETLVLAAIKKAMRAPRLRIGRGWAG